jgi:ABC-type lipoprotein export system ATPase subunit
LLEELNKERGVAMVIITHNEKIANAARKQIKLLDGGIV